LIAIGRGAGPTPRAGRPGSIEPAWMMRSAQPASERRRSTAGSKDGFQIPAVALSGHVPVVLSGEASKAGSVQCEVFLHHQTHPPDRAA